MGTIEEYENKRTICEPVSSVGHFVARVAHMGYRSPVSSPDAGRAWQMIITLPLSPRSDIVPSPPFDLWRKSYNHRMGPRSVLRIKTCRWSSLPQTRSFTASRSANSGHNRWSKIKHDKGAADARKSKERTKLAYEVFIASKCTLRFLSPPKQVSILTMLRRRRAQPSLQLPASECDRQCEERVS